MATQFVEMTSSLTFFDVAMFFFSSLVTGSISMSISLPVLKVRLFSFIKDSAEIRKLEIPPSKVCPISGDWGKFGIANLTRMSIMKCYRTLQNAKVTAFIVSELLREKQLGSKITLCAFLFEKFSVCFVPIFRTDWKLSTKFGSLNPSFNRNILTLL